ncbi:hypothetical protein [Paracoccus sulfuroxidans]|uniref:Uncharacterized protein n=1 Tax=Paracoccus sulfuroxidans TaxID=384678 RepID=A0A562NQ29_9RHOB|nr:hypothetical protein [Paracoccus sulfuroxidans]AZV00352.1 hypothetical protein psul1_p44 [Paracoccus phage vB_PsuS_Psul1]TWI34295.1 hypothetical protein IQ24_01810 [Paracoccus sulfuroxidans]
MTEIREFWAMVAAAIGFGVWLVRLEARVNANAKEIARLEAQMEEDRRDAKDSRRETHELLREVQRDIKLLLGRGAVQHWSEKTHPPR